MALGRAKLEKVFGTEEWAAAVRKYHGRHFNKYKALRLTLIQRFEGWVVWELQWTQPDESYVVSLSLYHVVSMDRHRVQLRSADLRYSEAVHPRELSTQVDKLAKYLWAPEKKL